MRAVFALLRTPVTTGYQGVHRSDERSLLGTSLAAESSLFRHPGEVYFRATACFDLHSLYTRAFASFLESVNAARKECVRHEPSSTGTTVRVLIAKIFALVSIACNEILSLLDRLC